MNMKIGDTLRVDVPDALPDPTDPAFARCRDEVYRIDEIHEDKGGRGHVLLTITGGTQFVGHRISLPLKYREYFRVEEVSRG